MDGGTDGGMDGGMDYGRVDDPILLLSVVLSRTRFLTSHTHVSLLRSFRTEKSQGGLLRVVERAREREKPAPEEERPTRGREGEGG